MSGALQPFQSSTSLSNRGYSKSLTTLNRSTSLSLARVANETQVQEAVAIGVAQVGATAMRQIAMVSQLEVQLSQLVPAAVPRLQAIGDLTALAMAEVVSSCPTRLNRAR